MHKIFRLSAFLLISLVLLLGVLMLLLPTSGHVERQVYIAAAPHRVRDTLTEMGTYPSWFPWIPEQDTAGVHLSAPSGGPYAWIAWTAPTRKGVTSCRFEVAAVTDSTVQFRYWFGHMPPMTGAFVCRPSGDGGTMVIWYIDMQAGWKPWWRLWAVMMDRLTGPYMDRGLEQLKALGEKAPR